MKDQNIRLSASIAQRVVTESPLSAWAAHRLLGNFRDEPSSSQIDGRMWHAAILSGTGADDERDGIILVDAPDFRTKAAQEQKAEILAAGNIPVPLPKFEALYPAATRIREELDRFGIALGDEVEERLEWDESTRSGLPVPCSGVLDHRSGTMIDDLKTGSGPVSIHEAERRVATSYTLLQDAAYRSAVAQKLEIDKERVGFRIIFIQTQEPFAITPVELSGEFRELSTLRWQRAIDAWHACLSRGTDRKYWPGPVDRVTTIHPPGWMMSQELELEAMQDE